MTKTLIRQILTQQNASIIAASDLERLVRRVLAGEHSKSSRKPSASKPVVDQDISRVIKRLQAAKIVRPDRDFCSTHYEVLGVFEQDAEATCCLADPFVYISHLSAMRFRGLTEQSSKTLMLTRPASKLWREMWHLRESKTPTPIEPAPYQRPRYRFPEKVRLRSILVHDTIYPGKWGTMAPYGRVATPGQIFLDMVVRPSWCGGISNVLKVWRRKANDYLDEIIDAVNEHEAKLPKVRAGYILDEVLGVTDERVLDWRKFAQRGSSQKLDPENPYAPIYSENWMLSLNVKA